MSKQIPNGTRIQKVNTAKGDTHQDGDLGKVISGIGPVFLPEYPDILYSYQVVWDDMPGIPVFIRGDRIKEVLFS